MPRLGLALSGGGFRATIYHLGVVRYLRDAGHLRHVTDIASVSGGSVLSAHLVLNWDRYHGSDEDFDEAAREVVKFVQFDVRNHIIRRLPMTYALRRLARLTPFDGRRITPNAILERCYLSLYGDRRLYELPEQPALHILSTNVINGGLSVFNRNGLYVKLRDDSFSSEHVEGTMASISSVVGASSAFPGLFPPVEITAADIGVREGRFTSEWFTDGGVYDNLGIRAFLWLKEQNAEFDQIFVSDAGKPFQILSDASLGFVGQSVRASDILWDRVWQLEREGFGEQKGFVFLPITEQVSVAEDPTAMHPVVQAEVQSIRTDLDRFSDLEINSLTKHGYEVARKLCSPIGYGSEQSALVPPWAPIRDEEEAQPASGEPSDGPSQHTREALELRKSANRRTWSTLLSWRDWTSYMYVALALLLFVYLPLEIYDVNRHARVQQSVVEAIRLGVPDVEEILELVDTDPMADWAPESMEEKDSLGELEYTGIEIRTHSRIIDLRQWQPEATEPAEQGHIYVRDRRDLRLAESYEGDRQITFRNTTPLADVECRQRHSLIRGVISKIAGTSADSANETFYEVDYDLSKVPLGEPVVLELETVARFRGWMEGRIPFETRMNMELLIVWMLFPVDRPYRSFDLIRYPSDGSAAPESMDARYTIDHPAGSLMGWSVVDPQVGMIYEVRWSE